MLGEWDLFLQSKRKYPWCTGLKKTIEMKDVYRPSGDELKISCSIKNHEKIDIVDNSLGDSIYIFM